MWILWINTARLCGLTRIKKVEFQTIDLWQRWVSEMKLKIVDEKSFMNEKNENEKSGKWKVKVKNDSWMKWRWKMKVKMTIFYS